MKPERTRRSLGLRARLTLWCGAVVAAILGACGAVVYRMTSDFALAQADAEVAEELAEFEREVRDAPDLAGLRTRLASFFALHGSYAYAVATPAGETVTAGGSPMPFAADGRTPEPGRGIETCTAGVGRFRVGRTTAAGPTGPLRLAIAVPLAAQDRLLGRLRAVLFGAGPVAAAAAAAAGYWLARQALAPVERMRAAAERITAERLGERVAEPADDDELARLARTLNAMLGRLDRSFAEMRRFTADAAHELRTPLAVLRSGLEVTLRAPRTAERYRDALESALEDSERLGRLAEQLLDLAREESGPPAKRPVRLDQVLREAVGRIGPAAEAKGLAVEADLSPATVAGDPERLGQLASNLLDNAVKYTPAGGRVTVRVRSADGSVRLVVEDTGVGIPAEHLARVFDRFHRVDPSRSGETGGAGLGLAICRAIAASHGGAIDLASDPGRGTRLTATLPAASPSAAEAEEAGNRVPELRKVEA